MVRARSYLDYLDPTTSSLWRAAVGDNYDLVTFNQFCCNTDVDSATTPEFVWGPGGTFTFPTAAGATTLVSSSANDAAEGTGARTVTVTGLDGDYNEVISTVTLNGTTPVSFPTNLLRVNRLEVVSAGSVRRNAGDVTISINGTTVSSIPTGTGVSQTAIFTVPNNYMKAYLVELFINIQRGGGQSAVIELDKRMPNGCEQEIVAYNLDMNATNFIDRDLILEPIILEPKSDIWFRVPLVTGDNTYVGIIWKFVLIKTRGFR